MPEIKFDSNPEFTGLNEGELNLKKNINYNINY